MAARQGGRDTRTCSFSLAGAGKRNTLYCFVKWSALTHLEVPLGNGQDDVLANRTASDTALVELTCRRTTAALSSSPRRCTAVAVLPDRSAHNTQHLPAAVTRHCSAVRLLVLVCVRKRGPSHPAVWRVDGVRRFSVGNRPAPGEHRVYDRISER
jgi:hypothetical protein